MRRFSLASVGLLAASLLASGTLEAKEPLRFVFITCCKDEAFFDPAKKGMSDAARAMGVECRFTGTEGVDLKAQAEMVRQAVADGCEGIALNIIHAEAFNEVVAEAMRKGVPVVAFNVDAAPAAGPRTNARLAGVCQDFYKAGRTLGAAALEFIPPGGKVLITQHDHGIAALDDRARGIQEALAPKQIAWKMICSTNDPQKAVELISRELKADPGIRCVLGTGQTDTEAAGRAIERDFPGKGYASAGFDLSPHTLRLIKAGVIRFTIDQQPYIQGYYPVVQLTLYCRYGIRPSDIDAGAAVITRKDVDRAIQLSKQHVR